MIPGRRSCAHRIFDQAQAEAEAVEQRVQSAVANHRAHRGHEADHEQLALDIDIGPPAPASYGAPVVTRSSIGQRPNRERAAWHAYRRRVLPILWERQGGVCALCGWPVDLAANGLWPEGPSVDHIVPLENGGRLIPASNHDVRLVHKRCNSARPRLRRRWP